MHSADSGNTSICAETLVQSTIDSRPFGVCDVDFPLDFDMCPVWTPTPLTFAYDWSSYFESLDGNNDTFNPLVPTTVNSTMEPTLESHSTSYPQDIFNSCWNSFTFPLCPIESSFQQNGPSLGFDTFFSFEPLLF